MGEDWTGTQQLMRSVLSSDIPLLQTVNDGLLSRSGKQLRPMVCLLAARVCSDNGRAGSDSVRYAAASEILHNATLIHDDVADESPERRGVPTVASVLGSSSAVLLGDFWLSKAVTTVLSAQEHEGVLSLFSKTLCDLSEGEMLQLQNAESALTDEESYLRVIYCKTASLFETACVSGGYSVKASAEKISAIRQYARALGYAFQLKDDILDYSGDEKLGKPTGSDLKERKITLPLLGAMKNVPARESELRRMVKEIPSHPEYCDDLRNFVLGNGGLEYASSKLENFITEAVKSLDIFENSPQKDYLVKIARFNAFRTV